VTHTPTPGHPGEPPEYDPTVYGRGPAWIGLGSIDRWHRPKRGKGPLRSLCLRCETPVSSHPSWWQRQRRNGFEDVFVGMLWSLTLGGAAVVVVRGLIDAL
jgi:hypothetical protein